MIDQNLIKILKSINDLLLLKGENPFKARAYQVASDYILEHNIDVHEHFAAGTLAEIKGFGDALVSKIADYCQNGEMAYYKKLQLEVPSGLVDISKISGLGPTKARKLYFDLGITSLDKLKTACEDGTLAKEKGFAAKSVEQFSNSIDKILADRGKVLISTGTVIAEEFAEILKSNPEVKKFAFCGDIPRGLEIITKAEFLVELKDGSSIDDFCEATNHLHPIADNGIIRIDEFGDIPIHIYFAESDKFYFALHELNSHPHYHTALEEMLNSQSYEIRDKAIHKDGEIIQFASEKEVYTKLGLQYVPVEIRHEPQTIQFSNQGFIPDLIEETDMRGMLHCHSTYSDGRNTLREMALAAKALGYTYFAICDHSRTAVYANGLTIERLENQHREIDELNAENLGIKILKGIESDILADGSLDYPEEILAKFDLVVASVHNNFKLTKSQMTNRIISAVRSPYTTILGHPTGRKLLKREGYELDLKEILHVAKEEGKIVEINANPNRLDMDAEYALYAKQIGVPIAINPDAHSTMGLRDVRWGIKIARRAWIEKSNVVNCLSYDDFAKQYVRKK